MASWSSKIMAAVGAAVIAPAAKLGMPAHFYYRIDDRPMPAPVHDTWQAQRDRLFVNTVRRKIYQRLSVFVSAVNVPIFVLLLLLYWFM